jgi:hypothetical protein
MAQQTAQETLGVEQRRRFKRDGFLVLRDALEDDTVTRARDALWEAIPEDRDDPASWFARDGDHDEILHRGSGSQSGENLPTVEPFEQLFRDVYPYAEALVGPDRLADPGERPAEYCLHGGHLMSSRHGGESVVEHDGAVGPILQYPSDLEDPLEEPFDYTEQRHVDGGTGPYAEGTDVEYLPFTIAMAIYFDEVVPRGGGFTVWPGSHRKTAGYFQNHSYGEYMDDYPEVHSDLELGPAHEITGEAGTLVLWHHNIVHGAAPNHADRIRMAGFQRIARSDIGDIRQSALSDPWLQYDALRDVESVQHAEYGVYPPQTGPGRGE